MRRGKACSTRFTGVPGDKRSAGVGSARGSVEFAIPVRATFTLNSREHWASRARKRKAERTAVALAMRVRRARFDVDAGVVVTLTRVGPRKLDDDNVQGALKAIRDEVAKQLGVDDGDQRVTWRYAQERGEYAVRARIESQENYDLGVRIVSAMRTIADGLENGLVYMTSHPMKATKRRRT